MQRKSIVIVFILFMLLLSGCDAFIEMVVNVSDLVGNKNKNSTANLYIEITGCNDYNDSRKPSQAVLKAKQQIPYIFKGSEYVQCFQKQLQSYVHFKLPVVIDLKKITEKANDVKVHSNDSVFLAFGLPLEVKQKIEEIEKQSYGMGGIDDIQVKIKLVNDTKKDLPLKVVSAYFDGSPLVYGEVKVKKGEENIIKLSNVSVDYALSNGFTGILYN